MLHILSQHELRQEVKGLMVARKQVNGSWMKVAANVNQWWTEWLLLFAYDFAIAGRYFKFHKLCLQAIQNQPYYTSISY